MLTVHLHFISSNLIKSKLQNRFWFGEVAIAFPILRKCTCGGSKMIKVPSSLLSKLQRYGYHFSLARDKE